MKVLLDTNIIIHREASRVLNQDIGILFQWIDNLKYSKYIHPITVSELNRYQDLKTVETINVKINSYNLIKNVAPRSRILDDIIQTVDKTENDINDSLILNEVFCERVDILISEDKKIHIKAKLLGIAEKVYKINEFLEKVISENPALVDYKVLAVKKVDFAQVDLFDSFFDSFREDYIGFDKWYNKKADESAYICYHANKLSAFLYIKVENETENYSDIEPNFPKKKRLKIGTLKVTGNGFKIGERFLKIIFDNALQYQVSEIYVTIFDKRNEQHRLIELLEEWGFYQFGVKNTPTGQEKVLVKNFDRKQVIDIEQPKKTFPFISMEKKFFIVPIYPKYHTELFPDSILRTESPKNFVENEPHRNALSKVYISRSIERNLAPGDILVFYRTGGIYEGVATTYGIVESIICGIPDENTFIQLCRKRSVFTDDELREAWNYNPYHKNEKAIKRPFIVNFIYAYSFRKRPTLKWLNENGIIPDIKDMPRGFREIGKENFLKITDYSVGK